MSQGEKVFQSFLRSQEYLNHKEITNKYTDNNLNDFYRVMKMIGFIMTNMEKYKEIYTINDKAEIKYFRSLMGELIFDTLVEYDILAIVKKNKEEVSVGHRLLEVIVAKLIQFGRGENAPFHDGWRGVNYYHLKLFGIPLILKNIVDKDTYQERKKYNSDLAIELYHHPLSLNGHLRTSWEKMVSEGIIYET